MAGPERPLRILFCLRAINFDRVFECFLRELLHRGHRVEVVLDVEKRGLPADATRLFDAIRNDHEAFSYTQLPERREWWTAGATALRYAIDYLRYLEPEYAAADALRARAAERVPRTLRLPIDAARSVPAARHLLGRALRAVERGLPVSAGLRTLIRDARPDVVLVSPLVGLGESQGDYVRAAAAEGIPTVLPVASWDNLTNKGVLRDTPTLTIVWNEGQAAEATQLHGLPAERIAAVGAHTWDHWFDWAPSTSPEAFAELVGLAPGRPFVLYVCSSRFIAGDEADFIREWVGRLRSADDERLRELGVLIRPHPQNVKFWEEYDLSEPGLTAIYPRGGAAPTDAQRKAEYYDSLYHSSAVVGINTSALLEAAIVRRPVLTLVTERHRATQEGTLHFSHLTGEEGLLLVAHTWDEHLAQLTDVVRRPDEQRARLEGFLRTFVRPRGLDVPAAPLAAAAVERAAAEASVERPVSLAARAAAATLASVIGAVAAIRRSKRLGRGARLARVAIRRS